MVRIGKRKIVLFLLVMLLFAGLHHYFFPEKVVWFTKGGFTISYGGPSDTTDDGIIVL